VAGRALDTDLSITGAAPRLGSTPLPREGAVLVPDVEGDIRVGERRYPGRLRISRSMDGRFRMFVETDVESYLVGVVPGEIPASFPREAQRVQAIIARTYALSRGPAALQGDPLRVSDSGREDQEYVGLPGKAEHLRIARDAVQSTKGMVALDGASPLRAWYHSTCGGHTCPAGPVFHVETTPALSGVPCGHCTASKYYSWTASLPAADVVAAAGLTGKLEEFRAARTTAGKRVVEFHIRAGGRTARVDAAALRLKLGPSKLRSVLLTGARIENGVVNVAGNGWGHGVGLCQMGAKELAERGSKAEGIVRVYYPGVSVRQLW